MTIAERAPALRRAPYRVVGLGVAAIAADVAFDPLHRHVPLCPFHALTGAWCPLCGGLRAAESLVDLHLRAAVQYNALLVAALPLLLAWWVDAVARARTGRRARGPSAVVVASLIALAVVFTVVRNLPFAHALRPG